MTFITIQLPWLALIILALLALYGSALVLQRCAEAWRVILAVNHASDHHAQKAKAEILGSITEKDRVAQELIQAKAKAVWRSFSLLSMLDFYTIRDECLALVHEVAAVYYPGSPKPEFEATAFELLKLNQRVAQSVIDLLAPFQTLRRVSVLSLIEAKDLYQQTRDVVEKRGLRSGAKIASRIWQGINLINPQYWIGKAVFHGVTEYGGRKALASVYQIVGQEAILIFRQSSAAHLTQYIDEDLPDIQFANQPLDSEALTPDEMAIPAGRPPGQSSVVLSAAPAENELYPRITQLLSNFLEGSLSMWDKMANPDRILERYRRRGHEAHALRDIRNCSATEVQQIAQRYIDNSEWMAAAGGAATGAGGLMMIPADAVSLIALQIRTMQQIGYCYGFDMRLAEEKVFAIKLLSEAYQHRSKSERTALLKEMQLASHVMKNTAPGLLQHKLLMNGIAKTAEKIGINLGSKKAAQAIPFIGAAVGGYLNKRIMRDLAEIANEVYQDRFMERKKIAHDNNNPEIAGSEN